MSDLSTGMFGVGVIRREIEENARASFRANRRGEFVKRGEEEEEGTVGKKDMEGQFNDIMGFFDVQSQRIAQLEIQVEMLKNREIVSDGSLDVIDSGNNTLITNPQLAPPPDETDYSWTNQASNEYIIKVNGADVTPTALIVTGDTDIKVYFDGTTISSYTHGETDADQDEFVLYPIATTIGDIIINRYPLGEAWDKYKVLQYPVDYTVGDYPIWDYVRLV